MELSDEPGKFELATEAELLGGPQTRESPQYTVESEYSLPLTLLLFARNFTCRCSNEIGSKILNPVTFRFNGLIS